MENLVKYFTGVINNQKLSHLYLISGQPGNYKFDEVLEVCHLILKEHSNNENLYNQIISLNHPNIIYVAKSIDATVIKKEDIINLQEEFSKTALTKGPRIFIINNVEQMSQVAANSLLKFLEEPVSKDTIGFLLTDSEDQVLSTIKSRSQIIKLDNISEDLIVEKVLLKNPDLKKDEVVLAVMIYNDENEASKAIESGSIEIQLKKLYNFINIINEGKGIYVPVFQNDLFDFLNIKEFENFLIIILKYFLDVQRKNNNIKLHYKIWDLQTNQSIYILNNDKIIKIIELLQQYLQLSVTSINLELLKDNFLLQIERIVVGI